MKMLLSPRRFAGLVLLWSVPGLVAWLQARAWLPEARSWGMFIWYYSSWIIWTFLTPPLAWLVRRGAGPPPGRFPPGAAPVFTCPRLAAGPGGGAGGPSPGAPPAGVRAPSARAGAA